jgi:hypothetical protein
LKIQTPSMVKSSGKSAPAKSPKSKGSPAKSPAVKKRMSVEASPKVTKQSSKRLSTPTKTFSFTKEGLSDKSLRADKAKLSPASVSKSKSKEIKDKSQPSPRPSSAAEAIKSPKPGKIQGSETSKDKSPAEPKNPTKKSKSPKRGPTKSGKSAARRTDLGAPIVSEPRRRPTIDYLSFARRGAEQDDEDVGSLPASPMKVLNKTTERKATTKRPRETPAGAAASKKPRVSPAVKVNKAEGKVGYARSELDHMPVVEVLALLAAHRISARDCMDKTDMIDKLLQAK